MGSSNKCTRCICNGCIIDECEVVCSAMTTCDNPTTKCPLFDKLVEKAHASAAAKVDSMAEEKNCTNCGKGVNDECYECATTPKCYGEWVPVTN